MKKSCKLSNDISEETKLPLDEGGVVITIRRWFIFGIRRISRFLGIGKKVHVGELEDQESQVKIRQKLS